MDGITPVMNVGGGNGGYGFGDGNGIWLFAILALMLGGNGLFGNRNGCSPATVEDLANQSNFTRLESQNNTNAALAQNGFTDLRNGICDLGYRNAVDKGDLSKQIAQCCCDTNRNIDSAKYEAALNTGRIIENQTAGYQKILDQMAHDKEAALQARISQLELQQAMCGVVKYPTATTYNAGYPFNCFNGCGGCGCNY